MKDFDEDLKLLMIVFFVTVVVLLFIAGCTVKVCECNDNSPKTIHKTVDDNSSVVNILSVPRSL